MKKHGMGLVTVFAVAACGGSGGGSASFSMMFEAPGGSGLVGGEIKGVGYAALQTRDFTLATGISVTGQVLDGNGMPLPNAEVSFQSSSELPSLDDDTTDGGGNYSLEMPAGSWTAYVDSGTGMLGTIEVQGVSVSQPGPVVVDFQFDLPVPVTGMVTEAFGPAIANAQVRFTGQRSGARVTVTADAMGAYAASLVPDTYEAKVTPAGASLATHLEERFSSIDVTGPRTRNFALTAGVTVSGTVLTNAGLPHLDSTEIEIVLPPNSPYTPADDTDSDGSDGSFAIGPVPEGKVTFRLEPDGDTGFPRQDIVVDVVGPTAISADLMLRAGHVVNGIVYQDDGFTPEEDVEVRPVPVKSALEPDDDETDDDGTFVVSVFPGTYDFELDPEEEDNLQLPATVRVQVDADMVMNFTLTRGVLVTGTVTLPGGVTEEEDVRVEIVGVRGASDVTDDDGDYSFLAPVGTHTLTLTAEDGSYEDIALDPVSGVVVGLPGPVTRDIEMSPAVTGTNVVSGTVYEPDGVTPSVGTEILAHDRDGAVLGRTFTVAGGAYVLVLP